MPIVFVLIPALLLLAQDATACLPTGFGGGLFGSTTSGCQSSGCQTATAQFSAPMPPPMYSFTPQIFQQPPPPPPPPSPPIARVAPPTVVSAPVSYQGMYHDRPYAPPLVNPSYQGQVPLSFSEESSSSEHAFIDPLKYIEHVSVSHTPPAAPAPAPASPAAPAAVPPVQVPTPTDPFTALKTEVDDKQQIQVAPSSASTEDSYLPGPPESAENGNAASNLSTYYNQLCAGETIATGTKETISSATKKCELLKCVAANAQPDSFGTYTVTFLRSASTRSNSKGNYCLSTKELPAKSKRVIRKFEEMMNTDNEEMNPVRRKIFKL